MKFGEVTLVIILSTAFSGFGIIFLKWLFKRKKKNCISNRHNNSIVQSNNIVGGDMAAGNIIKNNSRK